MQKSAYLSVQPSLNEDGPSFIGYPVALPYAEEFSTLHFHEQYEVGICNEGDSIFIVDNAYYYVSAGDAIFIPPGVHHFSRSLSKEQPCLCEFIYIRPQKVRELIAALTKDTEQAERILAHGESAIPPVLHNATEHKALTQLTELVRLCHVERPSLDALIPLKLSAFLVERYSDTLMKSDDFHPDGKAVSKGDDLICAIAEHLSIHYDREDTVSELAAMCHLSESQFSRRFIRVFGLSPIAYKHRIRSNVAIELLYHTDLSLQEISLRLGYATYTDFYRMFKKHHSLSPSEYRKSKTQ